MLSSQETDSEYLPDLVGEKLSSVIFVLDYLQLDFDGKRFTAYAWPVVIETNRRKKFGDSGYRDALCSLIARVVAAVENRVTVLRVGFSNGSALEFDIEEDESGREKLIFEETGDYKWAYWPEPRHKS